MAGTRKQQHSAADTVRELARQGLLARHFREASVEEGRWLRAGAVEIVWPLVYLRVTRPVEHRRGHHHCAGGLHRLEPDCLDRFHDDVEAVVDDLLVRADRPITNLEGWLTVQLPRATVDGHRRRRGRRGAAQRPRVPNWLADALERDTWLVELAKSVLDWVGVEATVSGGLWPLTAWTERRIVVTGDHTVGEAVVAAEVELVLTAMRRRTPWYERNVERPLGHKQAPVHSPVGDPSGGYAEPEPLALVPRHEVDDTLLLALADRAITLMERRVAAGEEIHKVVADVLGVVFGTLPASSDLDREPGHDPVDAEQVAALVGDPARLARIVATVVELLGRRNRPSGR
ncbi:hypothetical protein [Micromonospora rifamycinica]|uniref:Uncharacterized protein n=1 Tax=Micromonospora rifamycinica TaxID=291594 RepID=A0A120F9I8_9ACTN|nr:hypothetical protein [Micromonospora rifamycinica]KWV33349.1 hypothetical protein AWV63_07410 [Micromonospora rifamycinica]SCG74437.1 hypothetical protein GA0070623_3889 [Micromonospora rifamycinica]